MSRAGRTTSIGNAALPAGQDACRWSRQACNFGWIRHDHAQGAIKRVDGSSRSGDRDGYSPKESALYAAGRTGRGGHHRLLAHLENPMIRMG
jgi:hypothetical protein